MNISEKILARASGEDEVNPGEIVEADIDAVMVNDITGPLAVESFQKIRGQVWDNSKIVIVLDHQVPADSVKSAELHKALREFASSQKIENFYDIGQGICHQVMPEKGHVRPGDLIVGADSHTCTYGALGAFATGIGSTEAGAVFATGKLWFRVPESIKIAVTGRFQKLVTPKDLILNIIGKIKADGAIYKAVEFAGPAIREMSISGRMTLCNMAVEMGAKTGIIEPDETTLNYMKGGARTFNSIRNDQDANYERVLNMDVTEMEPQVSCPPSVDEVKPISEVGDVKVDQAFVGSCTNGRLEDLQLTARLLRGRKVKKGVRMLVIPASREIYLQALREGLLETFVMAGASVCSPICGPCFGGHTGLLAPGEVCVSSSNRNFVGRMGSPKAQIYLASPAVVAASAVIGNIASPDSLEA